MSGGHRQRLAIARALLKKPRVLILDEAVASLDDAADAQVADSVNSLRGKVTVIFITHKVPANLVVESRLAGAPEAQPTDQAGADGGK